MACGAANTRMQQDPTDATEAGLKQQIESLYAERQRLYDRLGTADADEILRMIDSLKAQLEALYSERAIH